MSKLLISRQDQSLNKQPLSKRFRPLQPLRSCLKRANADIKGLSRMLLPFFPRIPQRFARVSSTLASPFNALLDGPCCCPRLSSFSSDFGTRPISCPDVPPPKMAETEDWAHRLCFLIAEVTVIHSVVMRATGSTAMDIVGRVGGPWSR